MMPRPKSYDRQEAVGKACHAFWQHGYQALGVRELERITGINQFAIRSEFGGKEGLYLEALQSYCDAAATIKLPALKTGGIKEIITFLTDLVTPDSMTSSEFGCLAVNTGIENARIQSPRLEEVTQAYWAKLEEHFHAALENERAAHGGLEHFDVGELAKALVVGVIGVHAQNRTLGSHDAGKPLVNVLSAMLREAVRG